ncbi:extracellular solute-binding protein [Nakamurella sp. YIM 132087]|uniref:Extracellular solute-binding protein n=1 Tax=Nakamurella alba TaxID=2665158 RepID=A0A7K1FLM9_9ACTN|nr:extracellular solute-binding protein [Nakamurella alba]MTD15052.1 extracellular solute-binding protein [Nakamurella alba]
MSDISSQRRFDRRRFLGLTGTLAAAGFAAACGSNTGREGSSTAPAASSGASSPAGSAGSSAAPGGGGGGEIAQWYHAYGETGTQQAVEKYAAAYTDAKVSVTWIPGDYEKKTQASLLTDGGPDVFEWGNGPSIDMIQSGQVVELGDILGDADDDFTQSLVDRMTYDGKLYGVPQVIDMQLLVYRKSMLDDAGIEPPTSFDGLAAAAKALTTADVKGLFLGNDGGVGVMAGPTLWSVGADYLTEDNTFGFADPNVAVAFGKLHELFTSDSLLLGAPTDWSDPSAITQGLTAMQWTGLWTFPQLQKDLGDDFGVLPWPAFSATVGAPSVPIGAYGSAVSAKAKDPEAAKAYVKWLWVDNTEDQLDFAQSYGFHVPARKSLADQAESLKSGPAADAVTILQNNGKAQTPLLWTPASGTALSDAVSRIIKDGADPVSELAAVQKTVEAELERVTK